MEQTECSEMWAYKIQTLENYPEESIQHSEHGESLKSRILCSSLWNAESYILHPHGMLYNMLGNDYCNISKILKFRLSQSNSRHFTSFNVWIQIRNKDSQAKTQQVLWIFILFKVTM
jgi:hypothetical protein